MTTVETRLAPLDALRGVAALVVVLVHLHWACGDDLFGLPPLPTTIIDFGSAGVILFFVISGFSLDLTMPKHDRSNRPLLHYGLARFFRIAPLFYLMIPVTILSNLLHGWHAIPGVKALLINTSFLFNLVPHHQTGIVWASWTVGVEMIFYVLFPLLYPMPLWVAGVMTLVPYAVIALVFQPMVFGTYTWLSFLGFMPLFVIGMGTHRLYQRLSPAARSWGAWLFWAALTGLAAMSFIPKAADNVFLRLPIALTCAALIIGALFWAPRSLSNRLTSGYGALSYSTYLLHFPLILALRPVYRAVLGGLTPGVAYALAIVSTLLILGALAKLVHTFWEKPFERLRRRLQDQTDPRPPPLTGPIPLRPV